MNVEVDTKVNKNTLYAIALTLAIVVAFTVFVIKLSKRNG